MAKRITKKLPLKNADKGVRVEKVDRRGARQGKIDKRAEQIFLDLIYKGSTTGPACEAIGVSRQAIYKHSDRHEAFGIAWAEAQELGRQERADKVKDVMWARAIEGFEEVELRQFKGANGQIRTAIKKVTKVDNVLLLALAKSLMPDEFRDRVSMDKTVDVGDALAELMEKASNSPQNNISALVKS